MTEQVDYNLAGCGHSDRSRTRYGSLWHCTWRGDDAANARHMLQGKLEQDQLHRLLADGIVV